MRKGWESWDYLDQTREDSGRNLIKAYKTKEDKVKLFSVVSSDRMKQWAQTGGLQNIRRVFFFDVRVT